MVKAGATLNAEIENQMNASFPSFKWVCQIERSKRPFLEVTDKWPS
jgi:hypothetical protein